MPRLFQAPTGRKLLQFSYSEIYLEITVNTRTHKALTNLFEIEKITVKLKIFTKKLGWVNKNLLRCARLLFNRPEAFFVKTTLKYYT